MNVILLLVILVIAGGAIFYIYRSKKNGAHCIGCPCSKQCTSKSCGCCSSSQNLPKE